MKTRPLQPDPRIGIEMANGVTSPTLVRELVLSRDQVRNALDLATTEQLIQSISQVRNDLAVRAVLLRGEGAGFCAGSDVKEMARAPMAERLRIGERKAMLMRALAELDKPVVCAVHGFALGGGFRSPGWTRLRARFIGRTARRAPRKLPLRASAFAIC